MLLLFTSHLLHFAIQAPSPSVLPYGFTLRHGDQSHKDRGKGEKPCLSRHSRGTETQRRKTETWGGRGAQRKEERVIQRRGDKDPKREKGLREKETETETQREGTGIQREGDRHQEWGARDRVGARVGARHPERGAEIQSWRQTGVPQRQGTRREKDKKPVPQTQERNNLYSMASQRDPESGHTTPSSCGSGKLPHKQGGPLDFPGEKPRVFKHGSGSQGRATRPWGQDL